ncbi:transcriptional regulator, partial [Bacteroides thetaiotaomicron]|nr:transcriptional regulator [Bacteroides thetaiotaomicron]
MAGVYVDDLARLNNEIHEQINDLYPCHGKTAEQE